MEWRSSTDIARLLSLCDFPPAGTSVSCAVSGGADSLALLALATAADLRVTAIHVDHQLRSGSAAEADLVRSCAEQVGAQFRSITIHVGAGPNLEARARATRYAALPDDVMTGHTADDQAETMLLNLLRGAGIDGLAAMRSVGGPSGRVRHPLLALRRRDTEAVCELIGWPVFHDPSNADESMLRNRIRLRVLPMLEETAGRDLVSLLHRQATLLGDDADLLDSLAEAIDPTDARAVAAAPAALARRAIRRWLTTEHPPDAATVERVLTVARGDAIACELPGGGRVSRKNQRLSRNDPSEHD